MGHRDMHRTCPRLDTIQRNIFHRVQKNDLHCIPAMESTFDPSRNHTKFKQDPIESLPSIISHSIQNIRPCAKVAFNAPVSIGSPKAVPVPWHSTRCSCGPVSSANARAFQKLTEKSSSRRLKCLTPWSLINFFGGTMRWTWPFAAIHLVPALRITSCCAGPLGAVRVELRPSWSKKHWHAAIDG